ncbi:MAG: DNA repair exonuclease [Candidatus Rokubacteria bacterium]|nr:DNA repair exonuclease [Candidatus Rokubacteria bacterium]
MGGSGRPPGPPRSGPGMNPGPPRRALRVLHTADVHLDSDSYGNAEQRAAHRERERRMFQRIIDRALADEIDLLLIAGDLFDHNRVPDETIAFVQAEFARLRQPVVILPGNHDCLQPKGVYDRHDFATGARHVHVIQGLDGETLEFPELEAVVWGRGMPEHELAFQPLAHIPSRLAGHHCLALAHGFFYDERQRPERSSPIFAEEIRDTGWDYVALGHQHVQADVSQNGVAAWYAGSPGTVLRIDFAADGGVRVEARAL